MSLRHDPDEIEAFRHDIEALAADACYAGTLMGRGCLSGLSYCRLTADLPCRWDAVFALNAAIYVAGGAAFVALADTERVFE